MPSLQAYLSLEASVASTMQSRWRKIAADTLREIEPLVQGGKFVDAHAYIDRLTLSGVVQSQRNRIEELAVSSLLFGAHNCAGKIEDTSFVKKAKPLPEALQHGIDQLVVMVEHDGADLIRDMLHDFVRDEELLAKIVKNDLGMPDLAENGGLLTPDQIQVKRSSLYVYRPVLVTDELMTWAMEQGFPSMLEPDDLHVTICYSKVPVEWNAVQQDPLTLDVGMNGAREIKRFGDAIVMTLTSQALQERWQQFQDAGASWEHDGYRPHITISYDPNFDISNVKPYTGPMTLGGEVYQQIKNNWADNVDEVELRKAEQSLADRLNDAVMGTGRAVIDLGANLTTSRLVTFGFLAEAKERQITTYQISEVLDDHTCDVCEYMHGKTFSVEEEYTRVLQALMTQNPQDLKSIAPWPKQSKAGLTDLNAMSLKQMQSAGYGSPPFHPGCRGILLNAGTVEEKIALNKIPLQRLVPAAAVVDATVTVRPAQPHGGTVIPKPQYLYDLIDKIKDQKTREKALYMWVNGDIDALRDVLRDQKLLPA
ncbi:hypothetical protein [Hyphomicrobium sp. ghe19]|uniref:hypothetical protein n=1 Tax=Hyphomicrobium sp. ghe19 TaxID=2682968 RepID=UPI00136748B7|nr:hypothetical protein HYPP_02511 [Hyphomicrobium sp. ghe19]